MSPFRFTRPDISRRSVWQNTYQRRDAKCEFRNANFGILNFAFRTSNFGFPSGCVRQKKGGSTMEWLPIRVVVQFAFFF
jgi:hypothetical protein